MTKTTAQAFAPASMGNVGVGFDVLGLAFERPGDTVIAAFDGSVRGAFIRQIDGDGGKLPYNPDKNVATIAANALLKQLDDPRGVALTIRKGLPLASGLGSSAASAVAAVVAVNALLGSPLSRGELLPACLEGEAFVSGYHADNVAPALLGGITLIGGTDVSQIRALPVPESLWFALVTPAVAVPTAQARAVLPKEIPLKAMVAQTAAVAELIDALYRGDVQAVGAAMEKDGVIEPARKHLMPRLDEIRTAAKRMGAHGLVISGAGPTLCAVCDSQHVAERVAKTMRHVYLDAGIGADALATRVCREGAHVSAS